MPILRPNCIWFSRTAAFTSTLFFIQIILLNLLCMDTLVFPPKIIYFMSYVGQIQSITIIDRHFRCQNKAVGDGRHFYEHTRDQITSKDLTTEKYWKAVSHRAPRLVCLLLLQRFTGLCNLAVNLDITNSTTIQTLRLFINAQKIIIILLQVIVVVHAVAILSCWCIEIINTASASGLTPQRASAAPEFFVVSLNS